MGSRNLLHQTISEITQGHESNTKEKLVGIEVEVEGSNLIFKGSKYWNVVPDGSLRNGMEYVSLPCSPESMISTVLPELAYFTQKARFTQSIRTSVHFHNNVQHFTLQELLNLVVVYTLLENPLVELNGADRKGNLFCLRTKDADFLIQQLRFNLRTNKDKLLRQFNNDTRYASLNLGALFKFGTVEYRFVKGTTDWKLIGNWSDGLSHLTYQAKEWETTNKIISYLKESGTEAFVKHFTTPWLFNEITSLPSWKPLVEENLGIVYGLCYAIEHYRKSGSYVAIHSENDDDEAYYKYQDKPYTALGKYSWDERPEQIPNATIEQLVQAQRRAAEIRTSLIAARGTNQEPLQTPGAIPVEPQLVPTFDDWGTLDNGGLSSLFNNPTIINRR